MEVNFEPITKDKWVMLTSKDGKQWSGGEIMSIEEIKKVKAEIERFLVEEEKRLIESFC